MASMIAYTGKYRLDGDKWITLSTVPGTSIIKPASRSGTFRLMGTS
jgi:hypothetical protein